MKILYYILAFAMGYFFRKYGQAHKKHDELDSHAEELIRREQEAKLSAIFERSITMAITNYEEMSITSPAFNTVREAFDVALQRLLKKMEKSKMDEGQIALNITVTNEDVFTDGDAELGDTDGPEKKPVLKYKITTTVPIKDTDDGKADTGMALVWDKDLGRYVLVYMQTNQTSMYDNPPAGGPQQTTMNPAQQIGQGSGALIDIRAFRPDDDGDDE